MSWSWLLQLDFNFSQSQGGQQTQVTLREWGCAVPECPYSPIGQEGWASGPKKVSSGTDTHFLLETRE